MCDKRIWEIFTTTGDLLSLFQGRLKNCDVVVPVSEQESAFTSIRAEVQQGTVLGLALWNTYQVKTVQESVAYADYYNLHLLLVERTGRRICSFNSLTTPGWGLKLSMSCKECNRHDTGQHILYVWQMTTRTLCSQENCLTIRFSIIFSSQFRWKNKTQGSCEGYNWKGLTMITSYTKK